MRTAAGRGSGTAEKMGLASQDYYPLRRKVYYQGISNDLDLLRCDELFQIQETLEKEKEVWRVR